MKNSRNAFCSAITILCWAPFTVILGRAGCRLDQTTSLCFTLLDTIRDEDYSRLLWFPSKENQQRLLEKSIGKTQVRSGAKRGKAPPWRLLKKGLGVVAHSQNLQAETAAWVWSQPAGTTGGRERGEEGKERGREGRGGTEDREQKQGKKEYPATWVIMESLSKLPGTLPPPQDWTGKNKFCLMFSVFGFKGDLPFSVFFFWLQHPKWLVMRNLAHLTTQHYQVKHVVPSLVLKQLEAATSFQFSRLLAIFFPWHYTNVPRDNFCA